MIGPPPPSQPLLYDWYIKVCVTCCHVCDKLHIEEEEEEEEDKEDEEETGFLEDDE